MSGEKRNKMKICSKCKEDKELSEFHKGIGKDGLSYICKWCIKQYQSENRARIREIRKQWDIENSERISSQHKKYYSLNRKKYNKRTKMYFASNKKKIYSKRKEQRKKLHNDYIKARLKCYGITLKEINSCPKLLEIMREYLYAYRNRGASWKSNQKRKELKIKLTQELINKSIQP